jgi:peroxiredoxin
MRLDDRTEALKARFFAETDAGITERVGAGLAALAEVHPAGHAIGTGAYAPDFELAAVRGGAVRLSGQLPAGPIVLCFYRGGWCPFCSLELQAWQAQLDDLRRAGGRLLALAPEAPAATEARARSDGLEFTLLTDTDQAVAARYGLVFDLPGAAREAQALLEAPLDRLNADGSWRLPVPATYVIDGNGVIAWSFVEDDYTRRAEPAEVIEAVRALQ